MCSGACLSERRKGSGQCTPEVLLQAPLPRLVPTGEAPASLPLLVLRGTATLLPAILYECICVNINAYGTIHDGCECMFMNV